MRQDYIPYLLCTIVIGLLVPSTLSTSSNDVESCFWFRNATLIKKSSISEAHLRILVKNEMAHMPPGYSECPYTLARHACFQVYQREYGLQDIDPKYYFPGISFDTRTSIIGNPIKQKASPTGVRIAYILLLHKDVDQAKRLLKSIHHPDNLYVIHADKKFSPSEFEQLTKFARQYENMVFITNRWDILWGSIEMVYATLEGLFTALDHGEWDYVVNLSGADYPLCTDLEFKSKLGSNKNYDLTFRLWEGYLRLREVCLGCKDFAYFTGAQKPLLDGVTLYGSSQWFIYHRTFVEWMRHAPLARLVLSYIETTCIPDEEYFATVLMNSPFANTNVRTNMRYISFEDDHPFTLHVNDLPTLKSSNACFARKFDANDKILDILDAWRYNKTHM